MTENPCPDQILTPHRPHDPMRDADIMPPCPGVREPTAGREQTLVDSLLALHRPWYEIDGVRHDHTVYVGDSDRPADHMCRIGGLDACSPEEHYLLACMECRSMTEDGEDGHLLWPCPTARLALAAASADRGGES